MPASREHCGPHSRPGLLPRFSEKRGSFLPPAPNGISPSAPSTPGAPASPRLSPQPEAPAWGASAFSLPASRSARPQEGCGAASLGEVRRIQTPPAQGGLPPSKITSHPHPPLLPPKRPLPLLLSVSPSHSPQGHDLLNLFCSPYFLLLLLECKLHKSETFVNFIHICIFFRM